MVEKIITLEQIDPKEFFGVNNTYIDIIRNYFPKLKIIARGNVIKCIGEEEEVKLFSGKIEELISWFAEHNNLKEEDLIRFLSDPDHQKAALGGGFDDAIVFNISGKPVTARTVNQFHLVEDYKTNDLLIAVGPAGTGKTYTSIALAVRALKNKEVRKIILTRPAVEAGEKLGFLPGDLKEKLDPYLQPLYDALQDMINFKKLEAWLEDETIQIAPLAFMRGRTLESAFVILDEAQNATVNQLKMFLTRMGVNSKFILTGDITQIDLPNRGSSGLVKAIPFLKGIEGVSVVEFDERDIVRHKLVRDIVRAYDIAENRMPENNSDSDPADSKQ
ncbi:MAG: PhoH family protein [Bacteroidales bacterium]|nr:PhoH family protein [Bacteroidales bacterium]